MKKIVIVINRMDYGGGQRVVANLSNYFSDNGIDVILLSISSKPSVYPLHQRVRQVTLKKHENGRTQISRFLGTIFEVRKILREEKPDLVLSFLVDINILIIPAMLFQKVPLVISERNDPVRNPQNKIKRMLRNVLYPFSEGFVFQTTDAKKYFSSAIQKRSCVIPNPLFEESIPARYLGLPEKYIVNVGRLERQKNQELLIRSFALVADKYPDINLLIFGDGSLKEELKQLVLELQLNTRVIFMGEHKDVLEYVRKSRAFILSSDFEGMPNALIEALACGVPCISTKCPCGGPEYLIDNMQNGILVSVNNLDELAKSIDIVLSDNELSKSMADEAYKIHSTLNERLIFGKWINYLESVCRG